MRTQVYLTRQQHRALKQAAEREGVSMTELVRRMVDEHLLGRRGTARFRKEDVLSFVALGASGQTETSECHDEALDEALRGDTVR